MNDLTLRVGSLVLFLAILGASVYAAEQAFGDAGPAPGASTGTIVLATPDAVRLASPGTSLTFPVGIQNNGDQAVDLHLATADGAPLRATLTPADLRVPPHGVAGAWATIEVPDSQAASPGLRVVLQATTEGRPAGTLPLTVMVARPGIAAKTGDTLLVDYVGRFPNGTFFDTSVQAVGQGPFPKPAGFDRQYQPLRVELGDAAGTIPGFWQGLLGMAQGQSKTIRLAPAEAYGEAVRTTEVPRTTDLPRLSQAIDRTIHYPRTLVQDELNESSQVGDVIRVGDEEERLPYRIAALDATNITLVLEVQVGDPITIYPFWPGQSHAVEVTDTQVTYRTTPMDLNATFTWPDYPFWPGASSVRAVEEDRIVVQHSPPPGLAFNIQGRGGTIQARVLEVSADTILVEVPNAHPLAGQTLIFDVTVRQLTAGRP